MLLEMRMWEGKQYVDWYEFRWHPLIANALVDCVGDSVVENTKYYSIRAQWGLSNFKTYLGRDTCGVGRFFL